MCLLARSILACTPEILSILGPRFDLSAPVADAGFNRGRRIGIRYPVFLPQIAAFLASVDLFPPLLGRFWFWFSLVLFPHCSLTFAKDTSHELIYLIGATCWFPLRKQRYA